MASWKKAPSAGPQRTCHSSVVYKDSMYVFGGEDGQEKYTNDLWRYDLKGQKWAQVQVSGDRPSPRSSHAAVVVGDDDEEDGVMYVFGGDDGRQRFQDLYAFSFVSQQWKKIEAKGEIPAARCKHSMLAIAKNKHKNKNEDQATSQNKTTDTETETKQDISSGEGKVDSKEKPKEKKTDSDIEMELVVFGGWNWEQSYRQLHIFHIGSSTWRAVDVKHSVERIWHTSAVVETNESERSMVIFAGEDKDIYLQNDMFFVSLDEGSSSYTWTSSLASSSSKPADRYGHAMVYHAPTQSLFVFGGYGGEMSLWNDLCCYHLPTHTWTKITARSKPSPRYGHSCILYDNKLVVYGGKTMAMVNSDEVFVIDVDSLSAAPAGDDDEVAANWTCGSCTFDNPAETPYCQICGNDPPPRANVSPSPSSPLSRSSSPSLLSRSSSPSSLSLPSQEWSCGACTYTNPPSERLCQMCGSSSMH